MFLAGEGIKLDDVEKFLKEGMMMKDFNHPNVLSLIGVAIQGNNPRIVLPYMKHGDLKAIIKDPSKVHLLSE